MNHGWEKKRLGEVCEIYQPKTISTKDLVEGGEYDVFGANGIIGKYTSYNHEEPEVLLTCRGATCGAINLSNPKSWINGNAMVVHPILEGLSKSYLRIVLQAVDYTGVITGAAQPQITRISLSPVVIPLPSLENKNKIVSELDKLNELIEIKRNQLKDLDTLAQSLFYETFGEPFMNSKGWSIINFGDLASSINYGTSLPAVDGGYYPYIRMNNLTDNGYLDLSNLKYIDIPESELDKCLVRKGDILFNRTNSREKVGKSALFDRADKMVIAGYIIRVRAKTDMLDPVFAVRYLNLPELKEHLRKICRGAVNQANINSKEMASIPFIVPPINLQNQFASKIEAIEAQKKRVEASIADLETLLASRMDYWFND